MKRHSGNISRMARELGLTRRGLYLKLERYGLEKAS
jgi:transcriptional regulator of acetoin/glycerol metabolism